MSVIVLYNQQETKQCTKYTQEVLFCQIEIALKDFTAFVCVRQGVLSSHLGKMTWLNTLRNTNKGCRIF